MSKFSVKAYADLCEKITNFFHSLNISVDDNREFYDKVVDFVDNHKDTCERCKKK